MFGILSNRSLWLKVEKNARARKLCCKLQSHAVVAVIQEYAANMSRKKVKEDKMKADLFAIWKLSFRSGLDI